MDATSSERVISRASAISFSPFQNASSRLTLVLCPAITMDLLTTGDFIGLSTSNSVTVEITIGEVAPGFLHLLQGVLGFRAAMKNSVAGSCIRFSLPGNAFPCPSEIYDVAHLDPAVTGYAKTLTGHLVMQIPSVDCANRVAETKNTCHPNAEIPLPCN